MRKKVDILAVSSSDVRGLLAAYGLDKLIDESQLYCPKSGELITWENLGTIHIEDGRPVPYAMSAKFMHGELREVQ